MASKPSYSSFMPSRRIDKTIEITCRYVKVRIFCEAAIRIQNLQSLICCATHNR
jgi:hypothetical protein